MTEFGKGHHLHLIDGSAFIFRAYHALPPLTRKSDGFPVGAISGFCNMLYRYIADVKASGSPTHLAVIFDHSGRSFRNEIYSEYKANRSATPENLLPQIPLTRQAARAFNIACHEIENFEADDIIATVALKVREKGGRCTIVSSDKDMMQLVGDGVEMWDAMKNIRIDRDGVIAKFNVAPERVVDVQALAGDSVDNIPGAPGIGIKTAALLINEFGDLDSLLENAEKIKQKARRQTLLENREQILLSRDLVRLDSNVTLDFELEDLSIQPPNKKELLSFFKEMEFRTIAKRISDALGWEMSDDFSKGQASKAGVSKTIDFDVKAYESICDISTLKRWVDEAYAQGYVCIDTETTSLNEMCAELVGISLALKPGKACYIPLAHKVRGGDVGGLFDVASRVQNQLLCDEVLDVLSPLLTDCSVIKIAHNMKYDAKIFARYGIKINAIDDTMLLSYALNAGLHNHSMDALCVRYLDHTPISIKSLIGMGKEAITFDFVAIEKATPYAAEDADVTLRLWHLFKARLHVENVTRVYERLERPMVGILADMEREGIKVERNTLSQMSNIFAQKILALENEIYELSGAVFNVASPKQLGEILFDKMGLPGGKKGKTGAYATGANILEDLATEHEIARKILDWRQLSKLKSTYTDALQKHINPNTARVHTSYLIAGANTGRLASSDPNLQNIPIKTEEGRRIREAFVAQEGKVLVSLDYSQIELRLLAEIAGIDTLKKAFCDGLDIHALTASQIFNVPIENMSAAVRRRAKAINFGVVYGISGYGLARNLRIPRTQAQAFIDSYFQRFPGIQTYMNKTVKNARDNGYVKTLFGRKIHTPDINAKGTIAGFARRAAINAPIQGTAADIIRRAMIRMPEAIKELPAKMLLQIHDELVFEVDEAAAETLISVARDIMVKAPAPAVHLSLPLIVDAGIGKNWAEAH